MANRTTEINVKVSLDENHIPESIHWSAQDGGVEQQEAKATMLNFWDFDKKELLRMDLWVKDMPVDDMKRFYHQTFVSMAQSYKRATQEEDLAEEMEKFAQYFAEKSGILG